MWHAIAVNASNDFCNPECIPAMAFVGNMRVGREAGGQ